MCLNAVYIGKNDVGNNIFVKCGKCYQCLSSKRNEWTFRIMEELKVNTNAWFLTLTYSDENLPIKDGVPTLQKTDVQKFIKRLRKKETDQVRYYLTGEYGEQSKRPHYHAIIFNCSPENIEKAWTIENKETKKKEKIGNIMVTKVNQATIHYVTKYIINKENEIVNPETGEIHCIEKPVALMSRRPAIGYSYLKRAKQYHRKTGSLQVTFPGGHKNQIPRYYLNKIFKDYEVEQLIEKKQLENDLDYHLEISSIAKKLISEGKAKRTNAWKLAQQVYAINEVNKNKTKSRVLIKNSKSKKV